MSVVGLAEPWVPAGATLPLDQPFEWISLPPPSFGNAGRDAAIMTSPPSGQIRPAPSLSDAGRDIVACFVTHGDGLPPTLFVSAYAPDSSRGLPARADFWSRLDSSLQGWRQESDGVDIVLAMDSNTWLADLDPTRRASADAGALTAILRKHGLRIVSPSGVPTHRSGTVIDLVAVTAGLSVADFVVHGRTCADACIGAPGCWPALSSDHALLTLKILRPHAPTTTSSDWRFCESDWPEALRSDPGGLASWHALIKTCAQVSDPSSHQLLIDLLMVELNRWIWSVAIARGCVRAHSVGVRRRRNKWWNSDCRDLWVKRQQLHRAWRLDPTPSNREAFRVVRNSFAHAARQARQDAHDEFLTEMARRVPRDPRRVARSIRREMQGHAGGPPAQMLATDGATVLSAAESLSQWPRHLEGVARQVGAEFCQSTAAHVVESVRRLELEAPGVPDPLDYPFSEGDLIAARQTLNANSAAGDDRVSFASLAVDWAPWNEALLDFFNLVLTWGRVPKSWKQGRVVPLPKPGDPDGSKIGGQSPF